jgi:hypothetical protein
VIDEEGINDPVKVRSGHAASPERGSHAVGWIKSLLEALTLFHDWSSHPPRVQPLESGHRDRDRESTASDARS